MHVPRRIGIRAALALLATTPVGLHAQTTTATAETEETVELEAFIVRETDLAQAGDLLPTSRPVSSVFGVQSIVDTPRSVTVLTPELIKQFGIEDFSDLARIGAGTQQINFYGVPGIPTVRGAKGSVYYDGMQRAYNRNEMPLSFGSLEGMDLVKGPAPSHFGAALVGGYVNLIPKSPFFDKKRGSIQIDWGDYNTYRVTADSGGPALVMGKPAAYRLSVTGQLADSYYDRVGNDYVSLYGSLKLEFAKDVTLFTGAEYFNYKSNENAGWNRPTQNLVTNGQYVIGEPISIADSRWGGNANRGLLYGGTGFKYGPAIPTSSTAYVVDASVVTNGVSSGFITDSQRALLNNLATPGGRAAAYADIPAADLPFIAQTASGYQYTPAYFAAGGKVFTKKIEGSTVLADDTDFADSRDLFWFGTVESKRDPDRTVRWQNILEYIDTDKTSSYGYAITTSQFLAETKLSFLEKIEPIKTSLTYGGSVRFSHASQLQDFWDEPFSRRDISRPTISGSSRVFAGGGSPTGAGNYWNGGFGGQGSNALSDTITYSGFAYGETKVTQAFSIFSSFLAAYANFDTDVPDAAKPGTSGADLAAVKIKHDKTYFSASLSPQLKITSDITAYVTLQKGTAIDPYQGGPIKGRQNFAQNELGEVGVKTSLFEDKLYAGVAVYSWRQSAFNARQAVSEELEGRGVEFESTFAPVKNLTFIGSVNFQEVFLEGSGTPFRGVPMSEQDWALYGGVLNDPFDSINTGGPFGSPANNQDREYSGVPKVQLKLFATYSFDSGFGFSGGPVFSNSYWHNFDHTIKLPSTEVWNANFFYRQPTWEAAIFVENLTDEEWYTGAEPIFSAGTIITKAPTRSFKGSFTLRF